MLSFWFICALLLIVALIIILPSLLAKEPQADLDRHKINRTVYETKLKELERDLDNDLIDADQYEIAKSELQRTLIDDLAEQKKQPLNKGNKILPLVIVLAVPVLAVLIYLKVNNGLESLSPEFQAQQQGQMPSVEGAIASLEQKLAQDPNNFDGWLMLGRSYLASEKFDAAVSAYAKANEITNGANPNVLVAYGEAQGFAAGQKFDENTLSLFTKALQIDPNHERGLWYAGLAAYQLLDYKASVGYWERLIQRVPGDQEQVKSALQIYLNDAKQKAGIEISAAPQASDDARQKPLAANTASIIVNVTLAEGFKDKMVGSDTLFVYARAQNGPKMPLALVKMTARDLPATVTLDDSVSMLPNMTLSSMQQVEVIARISKSGQAIMQSGDMYGSIQPVSTNKSATVDVIISELAQ